MTQDQIHMRIMTAMRLCDQARAQLAGIQDSDLPLVAIGKDKDHKAITAMRLHNDLAVAMARLPAECWNELHSDENLRDIRAA